MGALAASAGLCPQGTLVAPRDLTAAFDLRRVGQAPAELDGAKLD
jgi:hypothetical protein